MPAAAKEIPVNPSNAAINATIKNPSAQRNILDLLCSSYLVLVWKAPSLGIGL
jgi:hypothetical protein